MVVLYLATVHATKGDTRFLGLAFVMPDKTSCYVCFFGYHYAGPSAISRLHVVACRLQMGVPLGITLILPKSCHYCAFGWYFEDSM
jgi:hypothetical protein